MCSHPTFCPQIRSWPPDLHSLVSQVPLRLPPLLFAVEISTATWLYIGEETWMPHLLWLFAPPRGLNGSIRATVWPVLAHGGARLWSSPPWAGGTRELSADNSIGASNPPQARFKIFSTWKLQSFRMSACKWLWFGWEANVSLPSFYTKFH